MKFGKEINDVANQFDIDEENLQELSKNTLKSYLDKAPASAETHHKVADYFAKDGRLIAWAKTANKAVKRYQGIEKAKEKMAEENIQELSQDTLKSYKKKATNDASSAYRATHAAFDNDDEAGVKKNDRDWRKRSKGLKMVDKKIVKEGVNGEHGPGDDEDSLDRIERKAQEKSRKAAAKIRAIKKAAAEKKNV